MSRTKQPWDFTKFLGEALNTNPTYKALFEKTSAVMKDLIEERVDQLSRVRQPFHIQRGDYVNTEQGRGLVSQVERNSLLGVDKIYVEINNQTIELPVRAMHDREVLIDGAAVNGFGYFSENFSDDDYAKVYQFIQEYWPTSGNGNFINFLGFLKNIRLNMFQLWDNETDFDTDDTYQILEKKSPAMTAVYEKDDLGNDGKFYPTSHVEVEYDYFNNLDFNTDDFLNLFYYMAPIHLVLHRITRAAFVTSIWKSKSTGAPSIYNSSQLEVKDSVTEYHVQPTNVFSIFNNSVLIVE